MTWDSATPSPFILLADFFGGHSEEVPPVPIPNTVVKLFSADGTAWETVWESRSPPNSSLSPNELLLIGAFCVGSPDSSLLASLGLE